MRKKRMKRFLIVLATLWALVLGQGIVTIQASANSWYGDGVQFKRYKIRKGNVTLNIKNKELRKAIDDRHSYGAWSPYAKGKYVYVCPVGEDSKTFGTKAWAVNMATGKINKFSNSAISLMKIYGKHLYYVESSVTSMGDDCLITFRVMRSNCMGKKRKLLKTVTVKGVFSAGVKLTNHKFVYSKNGGRKASVKF